MPGLSRFVSLTRRTANRLLGNAPWRVQPLATLCSLRRDEWRAGAELPENFSGVLATEETEAWFHPAPAPLAELVPTRRQVLPDGPRFLAGGIIPRHPIRVWTLTDVICSGENGVVWCPRLRMAVAETARDWRAPAGEHSLLGVVRRRQSVFLPGLSLHLPVLGGTGFYHFLHESAPRLELARAWLPRVAHVLVTGPRDRGREGWLEQAGVSPDKLVWVDALDWYHCEQLISSDLPIPTVCPVPSHLQRLQRLFQVTPGPARRNLWISRADASQRHLGWEDQLLGHLPWLEKVTLSEMPAAAQLALFREAALIVAPHGAGLANLAWVPPGGSLVEFFPPDHPLDPCYARLAGAAGWRYAWITADFRSPPDTAVLARLLTDFLRKSAPGVP